MTCVELQQSLAENDTGNSSEQRAHLKDCRDCAVLVADLLVIACAAGELRAAHEPSPHVWDSIEFALRQEHLIRPQPAGRSLIPSFTSSWGWARWALPVAAALLITLGIAVRQRSARDASNYPEPAAADNSGAELAIAGLNDNDLIQEAPALGAEYSDNLRGVNEYIQDAKNNVAAHPEDEDARRSLMEAYQEKAMLFELALDRSLP